MGVSAIAFTSDVVPAVLGVVPAALTGVARVSSVCVYGQYVSTLEMTHRTYAKVIIWELESYYISGSHAETTSKCFV